MKKIQYNGISKLLGGIIAKINNLIDIVELKADWEQTDPTAFDYIKNKPDSLDEKVKQENTTTDADYRVLLSKSANDVTENDKAWKNSNLKYNPSTGNLQTTKLNGNTVPSGSGNDTLAKTSDIPDMSDYIEKSLTVGLVKNDGTIDQSDYVKSSDLATVATSGSYNDLIDKPTIPAGQVQSDWEQADNTAVDYIKNKPTLATVATSGSYNDLSNKPTIPDELADLSDDENHRLVTDTEKSAWDAKADISDITGAIEDLDVTGASNISAGKTIKAWSETDGKVSITTQNISITKSQISDFPTIPTVNDGKLTINQNGTLKGEFTANDSDDVTVNLTDTTYTASGLVSIDANNNITTTAEVNQNAFAKVKVGSTTVTADAKQDTLELVAGDNVTLTPDATNDKITIVSTDTNTHRPIKLNDTEILGNNTTPLNLKNGNNISMTNSSGTVTINATGIPTKTSDLTNDSNFVSDANYVHTDVNFTSAYETKLSGIEPNAQVNTVTGVKGNSETNYRTGNINITKSNIGLGSVDNTSDTTKKTNFTGSIASGNTGFVTGGDIYTALQGKADTGDIPTDFVKASTGGTFSGNITVAKSHTGTTDNQTILTVGNNKTSTGMSSGALKLFSERGTGKFIRLFNDNTLTGSSADRRYKLPVDKPNDSELAVVADIPTALSDLSDDATHRVVTDTQISSWNSKAGSDVNVKQTDITDNSWRCLTMASNATKTEDTAGVRKTVGLTMQVNKVGTASQTGQIILAIGNSIATGNADNYRGFLDIYNNGKRSRIYSNTTDNRNMIIPDKAGTFAMTTDIPSVPSAASSAPGKVASSSSTGTSTDYARADHTHGIDLATGDANGQVKIAGTNVDVKGLGSNAYTSTSYLPLAGGTVTGTLILSRTQDASGTQNNKPALIVGGTDTQGHIEIDSNEIMAKSNGTTPSGLYLNSDGGVVQINSGIKFKKKTTNALYTGSGTAGSTSADTTPVCTPALWTYNTGQSLEDGDVICIKIPIAGHANGVALSVDNGTTYKPVIVGNSGATLCTTHYGNGVYLILAYEANTSVSAYPAEGATAKSSIKGNWRVVNYRDTQPTVNNKTITIQQNGTDVDSFTLNQNSNKTINVTDRKVYRNKIDNTDTSWRRLLLTDTSDSNGLIETYVFTGIHYKASDAALSLNSADGTAGTTRYNDIRLGNNKDKSVAGNSAGRIRFYSPGTKIVDLQTADSITSDRTLKLPDETGTLATQSYVGSCMNFTKYASYTGAINKNRTLMGSAWNDISFVFKLPNGNAEVVINIPIIAITKTDIAGSSGHTNDDPSNYHSFRQGYYYASGAFASVVVSVWKYSSTIYCRVTNVFQNSSTDVTASTNFDVYYR